MIIYYQLCHLNEWFKVYTNWPLLCDFHYNLNIVIWILTILPSCSVKVMFLYWLYSSNLSRHSRYYGECLFCPAGSQTKCPFCSIALSVVVSLNCCGFMGANVWLLASCVWLRTLLSSSLLICIFIYCNDCLCVKRIYSMWFNNIHYYL